jgi:hypothetical protein
LFACILAIAEAMQQSFNLSRPGKLNCSCGWQFHNETNSSSLLAKLESKTMFKQEDV